MGSVAACNAYDPRSTPAFPYVGFGIAIDAVLVVVVLQHAGWLDRPFNCANHCFVLIKKNTNFSDFNKFLGEFYVRFARKTQTQIWRM